MHLEDIHRLIDHWAVRGRMLPRSRLQLETALNRFAVATTPQGHVVGCACVWPLDATWAEVRSLAVHPEHHGTGLGRRLLALCGERGRSEGFRRLFAWTLEAAFFERCGYVRLPHEMIPAAVLGTCQSCCFRDRCQEIAVALQLEGD
jgi:amino-acid N-acetyltransferase